MSYNQLSTTPVTQPADATLPSLLLYLVLVLSPVALKLVGLTRIATWSWWKVTAIIWVPWGMVAVVSLLGWLLYLKDRRPAHGSAT